MVKDESGSSWPLRKTQTTDGRSSWSSTAERDRPSISMRRRVRPAAALPYLADMAKLDWALNLAFHTPLEGRLTASDLAHLSAERLFDLRQHRIVAEVAMDESHPGNRRHLQQVHRDHPARRTDCRRSHL